MSAFKPGRLLPVAMMLLSGSLAAAQEEIAGLPPSNPQRGNKALIEKGCITCHSVWGVGGKLGPDLGQSGEDQPFQQMASMFWNHTPRMVQLLRQKGIKWPSLTEQEMADIISFIYYLKLLDEPGDPERGRMLFDQKKCRACHELRGASRTSAPSLERFSAYTSPVALAQAMWNTGGTMQTAQQLSGIAMPLFQEREMAHLQAYIRSTRTSNRTEYLRIPDLARGKELFSSKGCASCHFGTAPDLSKEPLRKTISEICGILWNHSFAMQARMVRQGMRFPKLEGNDLADILAYIYFLHFSRDQGDAARGERVFKEKGCAKCHASGGIGTTRGPALTDKEGSYSMLTLATSMWNHAPIMFEAMEDELMRWIKLEPDDMQDLSKYLRQTRAGK